MTPGAGFCLSSFWGPRTDTPAALARRWIATIASLQAVDPVFANWYKGVRGRGVLLSLEPAAIEKDIESGANGGYLFSVRNNILGRGARCYELSMAGGYRSFNSVVLGTTYGQVPDLSVANYAIFERALWAIAGGFSVERAYAYPRKLIDFWPRPPNSYPPFPIAWISYCAPRIAHLVTPPSTALVERRPDGGLLMAATAETFDIDNPAHMSVAREIETAVAPLNCTRPWEPEDRLSQPA